MIQEYTFASFCPSAAQKEPSVLWINVISPTPDECAALPKRFSIPPDFVQAVADANKHPRFEQEGDCTLILVHASFLNDAKSTLPCATYPVSIILTPEAILTVCSRKKLREIILQKPIPTHTESLQNTFCITLLHRISAAFIEHLQSLIAETEGIEKSLQQSMQNKELIKLLHIEKSLIYLLTALKNNNNIIQHLLKNNPLCFSESEKKYMQLAVVELQQAIDMADVFSQVVGSIGDTFGAIVSNNLNKVMKILTALTIVLMIPTLVAGIYGMNLPLPGQDEEHMFKWLGLGTLAITGGIGYYFWKKDWM